MSAKECGECHELEFEAWEKTKHAKGFVKAFVEGKPTAMHMKSKAKEIAKKLGYRVIKRNSECIACHYTPTLKRGKVTSTSGVSCEACHGPGKDWINIHSDYGGKGIDYKTESPEHRAKRIKESRQAGMMRPSDLYPVIENCFQCHLVPNEKLVNVGGHGTGTGDFEFVKMANKIRHNFLLAAQDGGKENVVRPVERLRLMYVVGQTVQLEYVLRSLSIATKNGTYASSMIDRVADAMADMSDLSSLLEVSELKNLGEIVEEEALKPNNKSLLLKAANTVSEATKLFLKNHDGSKLGALDSEIFDTEAAEDKIENEIDDSPPDASPKEEAQSEVALNTPEEQEEAVEPQAGTKNREAEIQADLSQSPVPVESSPAIQKPPQKSDQLASVLPKRKNTNTPIQSELRPSVSVAPVAPKINTPLRETIPKAPQVRPPSKPPRQTPKPQVVGKRRATIRPGSKHLTLGPRSCGKCHSEQTEWWLEDKHKNTHKPFIATKGKDHEKAVKIAKLYGVKPSEMAKGTQVCMNCHGTVISKKNKKKVRSGVSCESCHGPAKAYLKPHEDGEKDLGAKRPGYIKGLKLGLVKLKDEAVRAENCASCHYITDQRLISSGHSSGEKFKYAERVKEIKHWESGLASPAVMTKAYEKVLAARGPVPKFAMVSVPESENRPAQKSPSVPRKKVPSAPPRVASSPIVPAPVQTPTKPEAQIPEEIALSETTPTTRAPVSPIPRQEPRLAESATPSKSQPQAFKTPTQSPSRVSPIPKPAKKQEPIRPASSEIDEAEEEGAGEAEKEALEPEQVQAVQELIIRDSLIAINEAIKKLDFGDITFDAPLTIQVNEAHPVTLTLPPGKTIKDLNNMIKKDADRMGVDINVVGSLEASLSGRNFSISTITPETQALSEGGATEWKWEVTPTKEGAQNLHLSLSALINIGGKSTPKKIRTFDQKVEISAGFARKAKNYFLNNWQWIWAIAFFSGIAWWRGKKSA